jgi:hypothetical protein
MISDHAAVVFDKFGEASLGLPQLFLWCRHRGSKIMSSDLREQVIATLTFLARRIDVPGLESTASESSRLTLHPSFSLLGILPFAPKSRLLQGCGLTFVIITALTFNSP